MKKTFLLILASAFLPLAAFAQSLNFSPLRVPQFVSVSAVSASDLQLTRLNGVDVFINSGTVALGHRAIVGRTLNVSATAIGYRALQALASGGNANTAFGFDTLRSTNTGIGNTAVGTGAGLANTTGGANVLIGNNAAANGNHFNDVVIGFEAGLNKSGGSQNVLIGNRAGLAMTNGTNNIVIGASGTLVSASGSNQLVIGNALYATNISTSGAWAASFGLNQTQPSATLHVSGTSILGTCTTTLTCGTPQRGAVCYSTVRQALSVCNGSNSWIVVTSNTLVSASGL